MQENSRHLPTGTVTFFFTDIEGSTRLSQQYAAEMPALLERHNTILDQVIEKYRGYTFQIVGDSYTAAFHTAENALNAALEVQQALVQEKWSPAEIKVRIGLHTGAAELQGPSHALTYLGYTTIALSQRIMSVGHGGQVLLSQTTADLVRAGLPSAVSLIPLGEQQLRDILHPVALYQLAAPGLPSDFPPLKTVGSVRHNLPSGLTPFIGREQELALLKERFEITRLLTLTGPGGTGKTRLALQTAAEFLDKFPDGVFFVDLSQLTDATLVPSTIAEALSVKELKTEAILETVKRYLEQKTTLIVLDNFEQVIEAASVVWELMVAGPGVQFLVTSREVLHISGEQAFPVPPMGLPNRELQINLEKFASYEAIRLFISRAQATNPAFQITPENANFIAEICYRLDGLPLAIELAAARTRLFTPKNLLDRLSDRMKFLTGVARDRTDRQQTMRGAIDWSYNLLNPPERKLFTRLEVFSGGGTLEAVETVCGQDLPIDILEGLESLLDKSLIGQEEDFEGQPRIVMLETLREYARERHQAYEDWQAIRMAHAEWIMAFAETGEEGLFGQNQNEWVERLKAEEGNIRAVFERCQVGQLRPEIGVKLAGALRYYWEATGKMGEGIAWLDSMLSISGDLSQAVRAKALSGACVLSYWRGDSERGAIFCQEALDAGQEIGDMVIVGEAQHFLGHVAQKQGDYDHGLELLNASHESFLAINHRWGVNRARACLADAQRLNQNYELAARNLEESIREQRESSGEGDIMLVMYLSNYGNILNRQGKYQQAVERFREGIRISKILNNHMLIAYLVDGLAGNAALSGNFEEAALLMGASTAIFERENITSMAAIDQFDHDYYLAEIQAYLEPDRLNALWEKGKRLSVEEIVARVLEYDWLAF